MNHGSPHKMGLVPVRPSSPMTITIPTLVVGTQYTMLGFIRSDSYEPNATAQNRCRPGTIGCTCHDSVLLHTPLRVSVNVPVNVRILSRAVGTCLIDLTSSPIVTSIITTEKIDWQAFDQVSKSRLLDV